MLMRLMKNLRRSGDKTPSPEGKALWKQIFEATTPIWRTYWLLALFWCHSALGVGLGLEY